LIRLIFYRSHRHQMLISRFQSWVFRLLSGSAKKFCVDRTLGSSVVLRSVQATIHRAQSMVSIPSIQRGRAAMATARHRFHCVHGLRGVVLTDWPASAGANAAKARPGKCWHRRMQKAHSKLTPQGQGSVLAVNTNVLVCLLAHDDPKQAMAADAAVAVGARVSQRVLAEEAGARLQRARLIEAVGSSMLSSQPWG
jgi:hypothetical protein